MVGESLIKLDGSSLTLDKAYEIAQGASVGISSDAKERVDRAQKYVHKKALEDQSIYGINTGFGYLAKKRISEDQLKALQLNILKSHACGYGQPLSIPETRLAMALRLNVLLIGLTGVTYDLCQALCDHLERGITPIIPEFGSVGASGDLAPLAHLALPLVGEGMVFYQGNAMEASEALKQAGLKPIVLQEKEGLGLINGTQIMLAVGSLALYEARELIRKSHKVTALTFEAMKASVDPLHPNLQSARGHVGQMIVAHEIIKQLEGSYLTMECVEPLRVQDSYSLRCAPQVHGASLDVVNHAIQIIETELNGATDNPLVFADEDLILSGGNFHGQPLALAYDMASMALSEMGNISDRRLELMLNPHMSGLPAFLTPDEGLCSGYMASQYLSASLVHECKHLANPSCTDSIPGNVGIEDHVSMGLASARKFAKITHHVSTILSIELCVACQAIDMREAAPLGKGTSLLYELLREYIPMLDDDRIIAEDVNKAVEVFEKI
ncbi:MAG: Histidine ammonia-lyase [Chlamydiae bacterium]|nr:Histidine ammonia-lyase [Chlamydiota bacterium]